MPGSRKIFSTLPSSSDRDRHFVPEFIGGHALGRVIQTAFRRTGRVAAVQNELAFVDLVHSKATEILCKGGWPVGIGRPYGVRPGRRDREPSEPLRPSDEPEC